MGGRQGHRRGTEGVQHPATQGTASPPLATQHIRTGEYHSALTAQAEQRIDGLVAAACLEAVSLITDQHITAASLPCSSSRAVVVVVVCSLSLSLSLHNFCNKSLSTYGSGCVTPQRRGALHVFLMSFMQL